jgi:hypothetical protein
MPDGSSPDVFLGVCRGDDVYLSGGINNNDWICAGTVQFGAFSTVQGKDSKVAE